MMVGWFGSRFGVFGACAGGWASYGHANVGAYTVRTT